MSLLAFKPNAAGALERLERFYARGSMDRILAAFPLRTRALAEFAASHAEGACEYPDPSERAAFWAAHLAEAAALEDDSIPSAYLSEFDQGLYAGLLGGDVRFTCNAESGWISSMTFPLLEDWGGLGGLALREGHPWMRRYERQVELFAQAGRRRFGVSHLILINGMNFAFELVGATAAYEAMVDGREELARAIELGFAVNLAVQRRFFDLVPLLRGGTCAYGAQWLPGRVISESVDPFHMTSADWFERCGRPVLERVFAEFDGGITHLHGNGRHLLESVSAVKGLKGLILGDDKGYPPCADILGELRARSGDTPLIICVAYAAFADMLGRHALPGGALYLVGGAPDADAANRCMERVRAYRC